MHWPKALTLTVSILALAGIVVLYGNGVHASIESFRTEAAADRRAHQAAMDTFRQEMRALADPPRHVRGEPPCSQPA